MATRLNFLNEQKEYILDEVEILDGEITDE